MSRTLKPLLLNPEDGSTQYPSSSVKRKKTDLYKVPKWSKIEDETYEIESSSDDEDG